MEPVVYEESPLADYLKEDGGHDSDAEWAAGGSTPDRRSSSPSESSAPSSPSPFAPSGRPIVKTRFRKDKTGAPRPEMLRMSPLRSLRKSYSAAVTASIDRADNAKFLEQFRYIIVASQLLNGQSILGYRQAGLPPSVPSIDHQDKSLLSAEGVLASILGALAIAIILSWILGSAPTYVTRKRMVFLLVLLAASGFLGQVYMRRQWLRYRREQSLSEMTSFVSHSHDFDSATEATLSLVQEVELVSRGYRISAPLPPVSRLEDRTQGRKCVRLRRVLKTSFTEVLDTYHQVSDVVKGFAEQTELEKYYDMYDITDFDISDALQGFDQGDFEDSESLRTLKIVAARFHTTRKMLLCALMTLDADAAGTDLLRWTAAVEALRKLNKSTKTAYDKLGTVLAEEESFPAPPTPKSPLTPGRERWRSQLRKLNSMSTGIRGLQAKLHLLREESDRALDDSNDITELGPNLVAQYDAIGVDLKELVSAWEEGKAALAVGIDRTEKRLSSMSTVLSPASSLSGRTTVDEGGAAEALRALTGESPNATKDQKDEITPEVFEAVALPRPRSLLTREERIVKVREEREQKAHARQQMDATRGMLRELETVINLRPKNRQSAPPGGRIVSM